MQTSHRKSAAEEAVNWVVARYSDAKEEASTVNEASLVQIRVSDGVLEGLIKKAITMFKLTGYDFSMPKTPTPCLIKSGNLEIWQPEHQSILLHVEDMFKAYIFMASSLNCALSFTESISIALANNLIEGSEITILFIIWKKATW